MPPEKEKNDPSRGLRSLSTEKHVLPVGKSWFFGIGINEYKNIQSLNNARKDIVDVQTQLEQRYDLDECKILFDDQATRNNILDQLQELQDAVNENDKLIIYYAGHGYMDSRGRGYWLPYETEQQRKATYLRNAEIREAIEDIDARHILLISDSCFSGTLLRDVTMDTGPLSKLERERSRWVISSGRQQEPVADGQPGTNSPFTAGILKVLKDNQNTQLNAALLFDQASKLTLFKYDQIPQSAPLMRAGHEGGQYIFRLKDDEATAFEAAQQKGTITAYSYFLRKHPRGQYAEKALGRVVELEEEQAWQKAKRFDRISDYFLYLNRYPEGRYVEEADQSIERLEKRTDETTKESISPEQSTGKKQPNQNKPARPQEKKGDVDTFTDPRDGQIYKTVELNGLRWMAHNLNFDVGNGCWFYEDNPQNGEKYGRLYTWEAAKKACPSGWRLPTDEEWKSLARSFGGYYDNETKKDYGDPQKGYTALMEGGSSGLSAQLGGYRSSDGSFHHLGDSGYYWSATEYGSDLAWLYHSHPLQR